MRLCLALIALLPLSAAPVAAQDTSLVKLQTTDASREFLAVGKLMMGDREFCTGALIAPDLVLTAAHCLFDKATGAQIPVQGIKFLDGWKNGRAEAYRGAKAAVAYPGYVFGAPDQAQRVSHDLALIALDQPILLPQVTPFQVVNLPARGEAVSVVSYAEDRSEAPSLQQVCHVLDRSEEVLVLNCDVDFGSSGAPIFMPGVDGPAIVSVISAKAEAEGQQVALASALPDAVDVLKAALAKAMPAQAVRVLVGGGALGGASGGAKFIKAPSQP